MDQSLRANIERSAWLAGIIFEPGSAADLASPSRARATKPGTNRNRPPHAVSKRRGASDSWRTSAGASRAGSGGLLRLGARARLGRDEEARRRLPAKSMAHHLERARGVAESAGCLR